MARPKKNSGETANFDLVKIKAAENAIRDIINWVEVWNLEELEGGCRKIDHDIVEELKAKLEEAAKKISGMSVTI